MHRDDLKRDAPAPHCRGMSPRKQSKPKTPAAEQQEQKKPVFECSKEIMSAQDRGRAAMGNTVCAASLPVPTLERTGVKI